jgi:methylated-DNA-[protein]-cysteine S-methyltransferase
MKGDHDGDAMIMRVTTMMIRGHSISTLPPSLTSPRRSRHVTLMKTSLLTTSAHIPGLGRMWLARSKRGLVRIAFGGSREAFLQGAMDVIEEKKPFARSIDQLRHFARGERVRFNEPFDLCGTPFQIRVWRAIARIPWGETRSYAWLARAAGRPRAVRAAANACGKNPLSIVIPCHRVIASDGSLGGFSGGLALKRKLLALEAS